jgi:acetyl-CoA carboxylase carboxyltransferase component
VIHPAHTRPALVHALEMLQNKRVRRPARRHGNIPL